MKDEKTYLCRTMKSIDRQIPLSRRIVTPLSHLLFIVIIFVLPELVMAIAMPHRHSFAFYPGFYVKTLIYIAVFYLNYYIVIDNTLVKDVGRRNIVRFILFNIAIIVVGLVLSYIISRYLFPSSRRHASVHEPYDKIRMLKLMSFMMRDMVMLVLTIGLAVALRLSAKWSDIERQRQQMLAEQRSSELDNLKSQLNPHFLFNTLNTIYALVDISPDDAKKAVHRLSGLLRYMLYEDVKAVRLRQEADFIENYLSLMKLRIADRPLQADIDLGGNDEAEVPPLLFIPLVENALKYGNTANDNHPIYISLRAEQGSVNCTTVNSFLPVENLKDNKASGIGLANLRRRLLLIYGNKASFQTTVQGNIYKASLTIPISYI